MRAGAATVKLSGGGKSTRGIRLMLGEKRTRRALALALGCAVAVTALTVPAAAGAKPVTVDVMTRNLYLGSDLVPAILAPNPGAARIAAGDIYKDVVDTNFPARAKLLAEEVRRTRPELIGLQEVSLWRRGQRGAASDGAATPATEVVYDYLDTLRHELDRLGLNYRVVSLQQEADMEFPVSISGDDAAEFDGRLTMRDVILARRGVKTRNNQHANYDARLVVPTQLGTVTVLRGWNSIDVKKVARRKTKFRFVNTHLESFVAATRTAQAGELLDTNALGTSRPIVLLGDLNSDPAAGPADAAAYNLIVGDEYAEDGAFFDVGVEENTCCFGESITDPPPADFGSRIDHVLARGRVSEVSSQLIGVDPALRTNSSLWPTDHGGVVARLRVR
jgi:endonuclease/exonuclease/phosphatase family metal-dependent hydrolase